MGASSHLKKVLQGTCLAALMSAGIVASPAQSEEIEFWSQPYGDLIKWKQVMADLIAEFEAGSEHTVSYEVVPWNGAFNRWLTVSQGGAAPHCADMFWLHSFSGIGGDQYGPRPINEHRDQFPNLDDDFYTGALTDVHYLGDFYGVPWRGDIRPIIYRSDIAEKMGVTAEPTTWDELVDVAKQLTQSDDNGNVTTWGYAMSTNPSQGFLPWFWQAGGLVMNEDGTQATIDNDAMRIALQQVHDLVHVHKVMNPDFMEKSYDPESDFIAGSLAMIGSVPGSMGRTLEADYPELNGSWKMAVSPEGPVNRDAYSGAGYIGVLRGANDAQVAACVDWIAFLGTEKSQQALSVNSGNVSPHRGVMASEFWQDRPWKEVIGETLNYAHTSQHPTPVWNVLVKPDPGAVIYDMLYEAVVDQEDLDEVIARASERMQAELDRANAD